MRRLVMRTVLALAALLLALTLAAPALAQLPPRSPLVTPASDYRDLRNEPNVDSPGRIASPIPYGGTAYPADDNGIAVARSGATSRILNAHLTYYCPGQQDCTHHRLLEPFLGGEFLVPGYKRWVVLYGDWADANGDGVVQDGEIEGWSAADAPDDPDGFLGSRLYLNPLEQSARDVGDEFAGVGGRVIVSFFEPSLSDRPEDYGNADYVYTDSGIPGLYFSTQLTFGSLTGWDQAVVRTSVIETISEPVETVDGERNYGRGPNSRVDVDLYRSVDPLLENVYTSVFPEGHFPYVDMVTGPVFAVIGDAQRDGVDAFRPYVGPVRAAVQPAEVDENAQRDDYEDGPHTWFNAWLGTPSSYRPTTQHNEHTHNCVGATAAVGAPGSCHAGVGGEYRPLAVVTGMSYFGIWHDKNGDGWIGAPKTYAGCPDVYACGSVAEPNDYRRATPEGRDEFRPYCITVGGSYVTVPMHLTPLTEGESWGAGVYIVRDDDVESKPYNPYDDVVEDLATLSPQRLVTSGTVTLTLRCYVSFDPDGRHPSDEALLFPGGMIGFDLEMRTEPVTPDFLALGLLDAETISDVDIVRGWQI